MECASFGCATCGSTKSTDGSALKYCVACKFAMYCCHEHQKLHWKNGHKKECPLIQAKRKNKETWEGKLMSIMKLLKSMQRRFLEKEISEREALKIALKVRDRMENFKAPELKLPKKCDAKSLKKVIFIFQQINEAFEIAMVYCFELSLLINDENIIEENIYDFCRAHRQRNCLLSFSCSDPNCPMKNTLESLQIKAEIFRDCLTSLHDGYHGIQRGYWKEALGCLENLITLMESYKIENCQKLNSIVLKKMVKDLKIKSKRKKLQRKLKSNFLIFGARSLISLQTAQFVSRHYEEQMREVEATEN